MIPSRLTSISLPLLAALLLAAPSVARAGQESPARPAAASFDRLKGLAGDWIDVDGGYGMKGQVAVTYRLTAGGSAVVETLFAGTPHEMVTVYHKDAGDLVLTHYCADGNQPRMRAKTVTGDVISFAFDGGTNLDPARDSHMHSARIEFISPDEIRGEWQAWAKGKPATEHQASFHLLRKKA